MRTKWMSKTTDKEHDELTARARRMCRQVAYKIIERFDESADESLCVFITSARQGEGKTTFAGLLSAELAFLTQTPIHDVAFTALSHLSPAQVSGIWIIDGAPVLGDDALLDLEASWLARFDVALVVAAARQTNKVDLKSSVQWLQDSKIEVLGILYNEFICPEPLDRWTTFKARLRRLFRLKKSRAGLPDRDHDDVGPQIT